MLLTLLAPQDVINFIKTRSRSRGWVSVLEIAFVGQCEVFVCLNFAYSFFFFLPWP